MLKIMMLQTLCRTLAVLLLWSQTASAQFNPDTDKPIDSDIKPTDVVFWDAADAAVTKTGQLEAMFRLRTEQGFTIYTDKLSITPPAGFTTIKLQAPPTTTIVDPISGDEVEVYTGGDFILTMAGPAKAKGDQFEVNAKYVGCTTVICLFPYTETMTFTVMNVVEDGLALDESAASAGESESASFEEEWAAQLAKGGLSFGFLILALFIGGLVSNLTPCVYPMIPITLRVLSSQGKSPYLSATFYALGIVLTYTSLGVAAAASGACSAP
jgi:thiol:disulfide interchange protein DsbD